MQIPVSWYCTWGTGISRLIRGLATLPPRSLQWSEIRMEDPQEDPLAVHCFCVCSGSVLLGDLLEVSRSRERDLPSVLSIYPRICVLSRSKDSLSVVVFCYMLMCVGCFGLVVSTCQVIGWKGPSDDTLMWWGDYLHKAQMEECLCVFFFCLVCLCSYVFPPALHSI